MKDNLWGGISYLCRKFGFNFVSFCCMFFTVDLGKNKDNVILGTS